MRQLRIRIYTYADSDLSLDEEQDLVARLPSYFKIDAGAAADPLSLVDVEVRRGVLTRDSSILLNDDQLHEDLTKVLTAQGSPDWTAHVLFPVASSRGLDTFGVMFDVGPLPTPERQGCAVFTAAIDSYDHETHRNLMLARTVAHEVGHLLNLCHSDAGIDDHIMREGQPDRNALENALFSPASRLHLDTHAIEAVKPGGTFGYRRCPDHAHCTDDGAGPQSAAQNRSVRVELQVEPGSVYWKTQDPTLVVGEPLHLTAVLINDSKRALYYPIRASTAHGTLVVYRYRKAATALLPPLIFCDLLRDDSWRRLAPGARAEIHETLLYRRGQLVFPQEGCYRVFARLWIRNRWVTSLAQTVHVTPPLKPRHERSCHLAADPQCGLFVELGGGEHLGKGYQQLRRLLRINPEYPLNNQIRLLMGRRAVLQGEAPYPGWRASLEKVSKNGRLPLFVRSEAVMLRDLRGAEAAPAESGERTRSRVSRTAAGGRLPAYPASLIHEYLSQYNPQSTQEGQT